MTCIVWHKRCLYADSLYVNNGEKFTSLTKVTQYAKNYRIFSEKFGVDDRLLGWFSVGSATAAKGIVQKLVTLYDGNIDLCMAALEAACGMSIITRENHCEVLMVCNKAVYTIVISRYMEEITLKKYELDITFHVGSGGDAAAKLMLVEGNDPLRAMHAAIYKDEYSGGMIEVWQHFESDSPEKDCDFLRVMIDDPMTGDLEYSVNNPTKPRLPSFIHTELSKARFGMELGIRKKEDIPLVKKFMEEIYARRDAVAAAEALEKEKAFDKLYKRFCAGKYDGLTEEQLQTCRERYVKEHTFTEADPVAGRERRRNAGIALDPPLAEYISKHTVAVKSTRKKPAARVTPKRSTTARKGVKK